MHVCSVLVPVDNGQSLDALVCCRAARTIEGSGRIFSLPDHPSRPALVAARPQPVAQMTIPTEGLLLPLTVATGVLGGKAPIGRGANKGLSPPKLVVAATRCIRGTDNGQGPGCGGPS